MPKIKVTIDGEVKEVESSDLDLGNLQLVDPENPPKGLFNQAGVDQVVQQAKQGLKNPSTLLSDPDHQKTVLSQFGISLDKDGNPVGVKKAEDEQAQYQQWYDKHAKPLEDQLSSLQQQNQSFQQKVVGEAVQRLTGKYLDKKAAENPFFTKGLTNQFSFDPETSQVVPVDDKGNPIRQGNGSLMNAEQWFEAEIKAGSLKDLARDDRPGSSGFQDGKGENTSKVFTRTQFDSLSESERHQVIKEGAKVVD